VLLEAQAEHGQRLLLRQQAANEDGHIRPEVPHELSRDAADLEAHVCACRKAREPAPERFRETRKLGLVDLRLQSWTDSKGEYDSKQDILTSPPPNSSHLHNSTLLLQENLRVDLLLVVSSSLASTAYVLPLAAAFVL
jgi:hypothetical protein